MLTGIMGYFNYWVIIVLILVGLYGVIAKPNLLKKVMALNIITVATIAFFLNIAQKTGATAPILVGGAKTGDPVLYVNPLPHALMLTAIVVGVAVTGVGLAMLARIYRCYGSLEEPEVLKEMRR